LCRYEDELGGDPFWLDESTFGIEKSMLRLDSGIGLCWGDVHPMQKVRGRGRRRRGRDGAYFLYSRNPKPEP